MNAYEDRVVTAFMYCSVLWALLGMLAGVYVAAELVWPTIDGGLPALSFGRLRTAHTTLVLFGFGVSALIATAFGLLVAIPAVWGYNYFLTKIDNLIAEMTYVSKEFIDYLIKGVSGEFGRSRFTREFNAGGSGSPVSQ